MLSQARKAAAAINVVNTTPSGMRSPHNFPPRINGETIADRFQEVSFGLRL
jgi:hypothetical protein